MARPNPACAPARAVWPSPSGAPNRLVLSSGDRLVTSRGRGRRQLQARGASANGGAGFWHETRLRDTRRSQAAPTRSTQKPFSSLWKVTRSTRPARTSLACSPSALAASRYDGGQDPVTLPGLGRHGASDGARDRGRVSKARGVARLDRITAALGTLSRPVLLLAPGNGSPTIPEAGVSGSCVPVNI